MLLLVNPRASSFSRATEQAVAHELGAAFEVEPAHTESPDHAATLSADATREGRYDAVAVLGGDGAVSEAANGLAGSSTPLAPLPGGRTNVFCRILGVPEDPARAAARLAALVQGSARAGQGAALPTRRVDLGTMNGRHFTFASGVGLTAVANHRLNAHGVAGQRRGGAVFVFEALATVAGYLRRPPRLALEAGGRSLTCHSLVAQNADPLTYLGRRPLPLCEGAGLETGSISLAALRRVSARDAVVVASQFLSGRGRRALRGGVLESLPKVTGARLRALDRRPIAVEVDGDYVGELEEIEYGVAPRALAVVVPAPRVPTAA